MLLVGLVISTLTVAPAPAGAGGARARAPHCRALRLSRELAAAAVGRRKLLPAAEQRHVARCFAPRRGGPRCCRRAAGEWNRRRPAGRVQPDRAPSCAVAQWVLEHGKPAGPGTATLPGATRFYLPLSAGRGARVGVLACGRTAWPPSAQPEQRHLLEAFASLVALAVERAQLAEEAGQRARLRRRDASACAAPCSARVSHDLRTPLAGDHRRGEHAAGPRAGARMAEDTP